MSPAMPYINERGIKRQVLYCFLTECHSDLPFDLIDAHARRDAINAQGLNAQPIRQLV